MGHNKNGSRGRIALILVLLLAFGLRLRVFTKQMDSMVLYNDPKNYWMMSHQLVDEGIFGYKYGAVSGAPNARVMPGYPLFLAGVYKIVGDKFDQINAVRLLQIIFSTLSVLLGYMFVKKAFKDNTAALITAFLMAVYPTYAMSPVLLLTETLALFTMLLYFWLSLYAFETKRKVINFVTGIAFGLHLSVRPTLFPLFILPFVFYLLSGRKGASDLGHERLKKSFAGRQKKLPRAMEMFVFQLAGLVVVLAPWWIRNIITLGRFVLLAEGEGNPFLAGTYPYFQDYLIDFAENTDGSNASQFAYGIKRLTNGFKNDFWLYFKWYTIGKTEYMFHEPYLSKLLDNSREPSMVIHFATVIAGAIGLIVHSLKGMRSFWFYLYGFAILGLQLLFVPDPRYAYLIIFFLITGAAHLISSIVVIIKNRIPIK